VSSRAAALLLALAALVGCRQPVVVDTKAAQAIPAEIAVEGLRDLLPKAAFLGCGEPTISFMQDEIKGWTIDDKGVEFRPRRKEAYRMNYSSMKGIELSKVILSYEVRIFVGTPPNIQHDFFRFNWKEEQPSRRALEYFEALREDR
jgi:hypothetical protein